MLQYVGTDGPREFRAIQTHKQFVDLLFRLDRADMIAWDTETTGLQTEENGFQLVGICCAVDSRVGYYIPVNHKEPARLSLFARDLVQLDEAFVLKSLKRYFEGERNLWWNFKYDYKTLKRVYKDVLDEDIDPNALIDGLLLVRNVDDTLSSLKLKDRARNDLALSASKFSQFDDSDIQTAPIEQACDYAAADALNTFSLCQYWLGKQYEPANRDCAAVFWDIEMPVIKAVADTERAGIRLNEEYIYKLEERLKQALQEPESKALSLIQKMAPSFLQDHPDFKLSQHDKLAYLMFEVMQLPNPNLASGKTKVDKATLKKVKRTVKSKNVHQLIDCIQ